MSPALLFILAPRELATVGRGEEQSVGVDSIRMMLVRLVEARSVLWRLLMVARRDGYTVT